ncbi:hypothetical protein Q0F98_31795 [Paenibacillus amylolyticus]|nr:hypothetical protein Q0F98_31795 [Paenibacillus amylolyticus]
MTSKRITKRWILMTALAVVLVGILWTVVTAVRISVYTDQDSSRISDAAIILGAAVEGDNPSPVFLNVLNTGLNYTVRVPFVICFSQVAQVVMESIRKLKWVRSMPSHMA